MKFTVIEPTVKNRIAIQLLKGEDVFIKLSDDEFLGSWDCLYRNCPWTTIYQNKDHVITWYSTYKHSFMPILIIGERDGKVTGLLPMATAIHSSKKNKRQIVGAGHYDADYQTWLAEESDSDEFIQMALTELIHHFPSQSIKFRHLPSSTPISWIHNDSRWEQICVLKTLSRPYIDIKTFSISKRDRKKVKALMGQDNVTCEHITDPDRIYNIIDTVANLHDFRRAAMYNSYPFRGNSYNKHFMLELSRKGLLTISIIYHNETVIAALATINDKNTAYLHGVNAYAPSYARYSPAYIQFIMVGLHLAQQGISTFDLTPGGDYYKERLATHHDQVHELLITKSVTDRKLASFRIFLFDFIAKTLKDNYAISALKLQLKKKLYFLVEKSKAIRERGAVAITFHQLFNKASKSTIWVFQHNSSVSASKTLLPIRKDCIGSLLDYESKGPMQLKWQFMKEALERLEAGQHVYTFTENGVLLGCVWSIDKNKLSPKNEDEYTAMLPLSAPVLEGFTCHPNGSSSYTAFLLTVALTVQAEQGADQIFAKTRANDAAFHHRLKAAGFKELN